MDPVNAAGLGLGAASLAFQIFDGVLKGYRYFECAAHADQEAKVFQLRLQIEQQRLIDWATITGLHGGGSHWQYDDRIGPNRAIVVAILSEIGLILEHLKAILRPERMSNDNLNDRALQDALTHSSTFDTFKEDWDQASSNDSSTCPTSTQPKRQSSLSRIVSFMEGVTGNSKHQRRLKWAIVDRKKCLHSLERLRELTDCLQEMVGETRVQHLLHSSHETQLTLLQLSENVKDLTSLMVATNSSQEYPETASSYNPSSIRDLKFRALFKDLAAFKIKIRLAASKEGGAKAFPDTFLTSLKRVENPYDESRTLAMLDQEVIWIEWKRYVPEKYEYLGPGLYRAISRGATLQHVQQLTFLLQQEKPAAFRVPSCLGYVRDYQNEQFGFVFKRSEDDGKRPSSLYTSLGRGQVPLDHRIEIARQLSDAMLYLHAVGWLHKGFRSASVLFFLRSEDGGSPCLDFQQAYISDFEFSRPDEIGLTTTAPPDEEAYAPYVHPDYYHSRSHHRFHRSFDIYSLGIVLVELALWKPITRVMESLGCDCAQAEPDARPRPPSQLDTPPESPVRNTHQESPLDPRNIQTSIIDEDGDISRKIRMVMGKQYLSVVQACVRGLEVTLGTQMTENAYLQQSFIREVLEPLKVITV
ncbi:prion-inhibition and propagation-domain-containing protein [Delphinella strobiligena]|nr:prion-inhibition and propagation-domain-containing protein [Delphinella strobiligena]